MTDTEIEIAEDLACGEDYCLVCSRATDHLGEHSRAQIVVWAMKPGMMQSILWAKIADAQA